VRRARLRLEGGRADPGATQVESLEPGERRVPCERGRRGIVAL